MDGTLKTILRRYLHLHVFRFVEVPGGTLAETMARHLVSGVYSSCV